VDVSDGQDARTDPVVIVSNDTHVGPRLVEDLRPYCPAAHLEEFDRFSAMTAEQRAAAEQLLRGSGYLDHPNLRTAGHHDPQQRLADYDHDGVAAGVLFHGSMNMEPIPFVPATLGKAVKYGDRDLTAVGFAIYNRWLADFVSVAPHRHIGLAYVPMWDVEAAVAEIAWAYDAGLKAVNFPAMRDGDLPEYNNRRWEPVWAACEERGMPLVTHVGAATNASYSGLESVALLQIESGTFVSKRAIWWMIFAGVFERHPDLALVITETPGNWFTSTAEELDGVYSWYEARRDEPLNKALFEQVPRRPSDYMAGNVYFGASFASPFEVEQAVLHGLDGHLLWGRLSAPRGHVRLPRRPRPALGDEGLAAQYLLRRPRSPDPPDGRRERHRPLPPRRGRARQGRRADRRTHRRGAAHADRCGSRGGERHRLPHRRGRLELRRDRHLDNRPSAKLEHLFIFQRTFKLGAAGL
jgi:predicted TIM-barrel fold metal-dependent hydrolase